MEDGLVADLQRRAGETGSLPGSGVALLNLLNRHLRITRAQPGCLFIPARREGVEGGQQLAQARGRIKEILTNVPFHADLRMVLQLSRIPAKHRDDGTETLCQCQRLRMGATPLC